MSDTNVLDVLIIADQAAWTHQARQVLEALSCHVQQTGSEDAALSMAREQQPGLILLSAPYGSDLARRLREALATPTLILLVTEGATDRGRPPEGIDDVLAAPPGIHELTAYASAARCLRRAWRPTIVNPGPAMLPMQLLDAASVWINVTDTTGAITFWNRAAAQISGYSASEVVGHARVWEWLYPQPAERRRALSHALKVSAERMHDAQTERAIRCKDGSTRIIRWYSSPLLDAHGQPLGNVVVGIDVTEQRHAEALLRDHARREASLRRIIAAATQASDLETLLHTAIDETMAALKAPMGAIWAGQYAVVRNADQGVLAALARGGRVEEMLSATPIVINDWAGSDLPPRCRPNAPIALSAGIRTTLAVPIVTDGALIGMLALADSQPRDWSPEDVEMVESVGRQLGAVAKRLHLIHELQDALQAREEMLQNVSHELRTPLTLIQGYAELLKDNLIDLQVEDARQAAQSIYGAARQLAFMVDRLLLLQSIEPAIQSRFPMDPQVWIRSRVDDWRDRFQAAGIELELDLEEELPEILGAPDLLGQLLNDLLHNALKFSPGGGKVRIAARRRDGGIEVSVQDQGVGISADQMERLFAPFRQGDGSKTRRFGGMGIGLHLCKKIVDAHGGKIWATSAGPGKGATFYIWLPATPSTSLPTGEGAILRRDVEREDGRRDGALRAGGAEEGAHSPDDGRAASGGLRSWVAHGDHG